MNVRLLLLLALFLVAGCSSPEESPYAGQEARVIKTLSDEEVEGYTTGQGMGLAKAAELNHYPGPKHALTLTDDLALSDAQRAETQDIFETMQAEAVRLGRQIVAKETELDALFAEGHATPKRMRALVRALGVLKSDLRFAHLKAHLKMKALLTEAQVQRYDELRGYDASAPPASSIPPTCTIDGAIDLSNSKFEALIPKQLRERCEEPRSLGAEESRSRGV